MMEYLLRTGEYSRGMAELPEATDVVVIGGGIVGASIAYHLAEKHGRASVVLERHRLTSGTTWHAAGLVGQLRATENATKLARYSLELYNAMDDQYGTGFRAPGAISVATSAARLEELRRTAAMARNVGVEVHEVTPDQIGEMWPLARLDDLLGGVHMPRDASVSPTDATMALATAARERGAIVVEEIEALSLIVEHGKVTGVETSKGAIRCNQVVLAAGLWSRDFAAKHGVTVPLHAAEHYYAITVEMDGITPDLPILRDPDSCAYYKPETAQLLVGLFEEFANPWPAAGVQAHLDGDGFITLDRNMDHLMPLLNTAFNRVPVLHETGLRLMFNGPESFTPDDRYVIGETPEITDFYVAAGFNSIGIQSAGGVGWVLADWMTNGHAPMDLHDVDVRRFEPFQRNTRYLRERTTETLGLLYAMHWPTRQYATSRGVRRTAAHDRLAALGAQFGELSGWERPMWFGTPGENVDAYGRPGWFALTAEEHHAVRTAVGLFDQSSFGKLMVQGPDACKLLDRVSAGAMDVEPGKVVYTQWLNDEAGIEADLTVTRISTDRYLVVTGAGTRVRDQTWLEKSIGGDRATVTDVTSGYSVYAVMGPNSRALLHRVSPADLSDEAFPFGTSQEIEVGYALVRATRVTYVGEMGWELYVPTEFSTHVFDELVREGAAVGLKHCGYGALFSCRIEKGYRHFGHDIGPDDDPLSAGLGFAVSYTKDFRGREALEKIKANGMRRRLVQFMIDPVSDAIKDGHVQLHHHEPILRDHEPAGWITSGGFGHFLGAPIGLGYVKRADGEVVIPDWIREGSWSIEVAGTTYAATASLRPFYDPTSARVRNLR